MLAFAQGHVRHFGSSRRSKHGGGHGSSLRCFVCVCVCLCLSDVLTKPMTREVLWHHMEERHVRGALALLCSFFADGSELES
eukprot:3770297-Amphidinium_carterae.1